MSRVGKKPPRQLSKLKGSSTLPSLDYFKTKPLSTFNPSTVNEYFKVEASHPGSELSSMKSSLKSVKEIEKKANNDLIHYIAATSQQSLIQSISDYIRFFCMYYKKRYYFKDIERLIHNPVFTDFTNDETRYARELMTSFEFMFKLGRLKPSKWFSILISSKTSNNQTMTVNEFHAGVNQLCDELKLPHWLSDDLMKLFGFISNYRYVRRDLPPMDPSSSSQGKKSVAFSGPQVFYSNNSYIRRIDLITAFQKFHASSKRIEGLNHTASVLQKLSEFLTLKSIHLRDLLIHTSFNHEHNKQHQLFEQQQLMAQLEEEGFDARSLSSLSSGSYLDKYNSSSAAHRNTKYITLEECETMISILLSDFGTLYNKNNPNHMSSPSKKPLNVKAMVDHEVESTVSDLSLHSVGGKDSLPGYMKHGIPRRLITNSFVHDVEQPVKPAQRQTHDFYTHSHSHSGGETLSAAAQGINKLQQSSGDVIHDEFGMRRSMLKPIEPQQASPSPPPKLGSMNLASFGKSFRSKLHPSPIKEVDNYSDDDSEYTYSDYDDDDFDLGPHAGSSAGSIAGSLRNGSNGRVSLAPLSHANSAASVKKYHFDLEPHHLHLNSSKNFSHDAINPKLILKHDPNIAYYKRVIDNFDRRIGIAKRKLNKIK